MRCHPLADVRSIGLDILFDANYIARGNRRGCPRGPTAHSPGSSHGTATSALLPYQHRPWGTLGSLAECLPATPKKQRRWLVMKSLLGVEGTKNNVEDDLF